MYKTKTGKRNLEGTGNRVYGCFILDVEKTGWIQLSVERMR